MTPAEAAGLALPLLAEARPRCGDTVVVAVDGPSGSGKSTLAGAFADAVASAGATSVATSVAASGASPARGSRPQIVRMDDIYPGWGGLAEAVPHLHDWVLAPLARGERAAYRRFDWVAGRYAEEHEVPAAPLLVVEGVGSSVGPCAQYVSLVLWVEAPREERFRRGIERDGEAYRPQWERWAEQERAMFDSDGTRGRASLVIRT